MLVGTLATDSGVAALCFYGLCCGAVISLTGSHLLATPFFLLFTEDDLAQDKEQGHKCLLPLDREWAVAFVLQRLAPTRCLPSSSCSSTINWSWSLQGSILGVTTYCPMYTCSTTSRISWSVDPRGFLLKGASGPFLLPYWPVAGGVPL